MNDFRFNGDNKFAGCADYCRAQVSASSKIDAINHTKSLLLDQLEVRLIGSMLGWT